MRDEYLQDTRASRIRSPGKAGHDGEGLAGSERYSPTNAPGQEKKENHAGGVDGMALRCLLPPVTPHQQGVSSTCGGT